MKLAIEKVIYGGQGLAKIPEGSGAHSGMRIFVPFTLPGEVVEAEIVEERRGYCVGEVRQMELPSEFRVAPPCPWFGKCGGCQLQHGSYSEQVKLKRGMLAESLTRAGVRELPEIDVLTGAPLAYRNRVRLQVRTHPEFAIGYRQAKSHRIVAIDRCPIAMPLLQQAIGMIHSLGSAKLIPAELQEIELFTNHDQSELLLTAWVGSGRSFEPDIYPNFFTRLQRDLPALTGAAIWTADKEASPGTRPLLQWGKQELGYQVAGREYSVSIGSFFQVNATLLDAFVHAVTDDERGESAWDLFAGGGLFSAALAGRFTEMLAVESSPSACKDLRRNMKGTPGKAIQSDTLHFLEGAARRILQGKQAAPDLVLLDPPRAGAGMEVCRLLARSNPKRMVYVSCDPATLGRDLAALVQSGYRPRRLCMVDMFPQTGHLETIATLER